MHASDRKKFRKPPVFFKTVSTLSFIWFMSSNVDAQVKDSVASNQEKVYKNTLKLNLTSWILYTNGVQLNYERLLSKKRSITLFGGIIQFPVPSSISNTNIVLNNNKTRSGFSIGSEYRFYLSKENKYDAPHGVYLAPFVSFYHFNNVRSGRDTLNNDFLTLSTSVNFLNIGGELGYQFVIKKRFVIDCVMFGPALSSYYFNVKLDGNTSGNQSEKLQEIIAALKQKFPLLNDITKDEGISSSGVSNFWSLGFRYAIHIGYRF
ncbi:MAG TPA: hypothetical protein VK622_07725 [Puia sp.]|nr:hypothetical protein [Puia sp.]